MRSTRKKKRGEKQKKRKKEEKKKEWKKNRARHPYPNAADVHRWTAQPGPAGPSRDGKQPRLDPHTGLFLFQLFQLFSRRRSDVLGKLATGRVPIGSQPQPVEQEYRTWPDGAVGEAKSTLDEASERGPNWMYNISGWLVGEVRSLVRIGDDFCPGSEALARYN